MSTWKALQNTVNNTGVLPYTRAVGPDMHPAGARWKAMPLQQTEEVADTRRNKRGCDRKEKYLEEFCLQVGGEWLLENWGI